MHCFIVYVVFTCLVQDCNLFEEEDCAAFLKNFLNSITGSQLNKHRHLCILKKYIFKVLLERSVFFFAEENVTGSKNSENYIRFIHESRDRVSNSNRGLATDSKNITP